MHAMYEGGPEEYETQVALWRAGLVLFEKDMVEHVLGTISARHTDKKTGKTWYVTKPQDKHYFRMNPEDFVSVDINGTPLPQQRIFMPDGKEKKKMRPSLNWLVHKASYEADPAIGAVVHAHIRSIVALASQSNERFTKCLNAFGNLAAFIPLVSEEAVWALNPVPDGEFVMAGLPIVEDCAPQGLAEYAKILIPQGNAFAIRNHGIMTVGRDIEEALGVALVLKKEAEIILDIFSSGGMPLFRGRDKILKSLEDMPPHFRWRSYNKPAFGE